MGVRWGTTRELEVAAHIVAAHGALHGAFWLKVQCRCLKLIIKGENWLDIKPCSIEMPWIKGHISLHPSLCVSLEEWLSRWTPLYMVIGGNLA